MGIISRLVGNVVVLGLLALGTRDVIIATRKWHKAYMKAHEGSDLTAS